MGVIFITVWEMLCYTGVIFRSIIALKFLGGTACILRQCMHYLRYFAVLLLDSLRGSLGLLLEDAALYTQKHLTISKILHYMVARGYPYLGKFKDLTGRYCSMHRLLWGQHKTNICYNHCITLLVLQHKWAISHV